MTDQTNINAIILIRRIMNDLEKRLPKTQVDFNFNVILWDQLVEQTICSLLRHVDNRNTLPQKFHDKFKDLKKWIKDNRSFDIKNVVNVDSVMTFHNLRNSIQHEGRNINSLDFKDYISNSKLLIEVLVSKIFNMNFYEIDLTVVISNTKLKKIVKKIYQLIKDGDLIGSIAWIDQLILIIIKVAQREYGFEHYFHLGELYSVDEQITITSDGMIKTYDVTQGQDDAFKMINEKINTSITDLRKTKAYMDKYIENLQLIQSHNIGIQLSSNTREYFEMIKVLYKGIAYHALGRTTFVSSFTPPEVSLINKFAYNVTLMTINLENTFTDFVIPEIKELDILSLQDPMI